MFFASFCGHSIILPKVYVNYAPFIFALHLEGVVSRIHAKG